MTEIPFSPGTAFDMGVCLLGDRPGHRLVTCPAHLVQLPVRDRLQLPHLISASPAHGAGSRKQEADLASLALRPYLRDHHAQPPSIYK